MRNTTRPGHGSGNSRNSSTGKRLLTEVGGVDLQVPRGSGEARVGGRQVQDDERVAGMDQVGWLHERHVRHGHVGVHRVEPVGEYLGRVVRVRDGVLLLEFVAVEPAASGDPARDDRDDVARDGGPAVRRSPSDGTSHPIRRARRPAGHQWWSGHRRRAWLWTVVDSFVVLNFGVQGVAHGVGHGVLSTGVGVVNPGQLRPAGAGDEAVSVGWLSPAGSERRLRPGGSTPARRAMAAGSLVRCAAARGCPGRRTSGWPIRSEHRPGARRGSPRRER
jgi:hypothetical protein